MNNGGCELYCTNTVGSYSCSCGSGYYLLGDLHSCYDINECISSSHGCEHYCKNSEGSYSCQCSTGYTLASDGKACEDINECNQIPSVCSQQCTNSAGSYSCSCISGYRLDSNKITCNDIDDCYENTNLCPSPKKCVNQPGTYVCNCLPGYQKLQNPERCQDINECTSGTHLCEQTCTNTIGSYACSCNNNYYLASNYSCQIVTFTVSISPYSYGSSYAQFSTVIQYSHTTYGINVTNQIHALDLSFGNGNYEVNSPTKSNYPIISSLKPYRLYRFYVTTTGALYSADSNYYMLRTATSTPRTPPQNVTTVSTSNSLSIEWAAPPAPDRNGIITDYILQYKMSNASSYTTTPPISTTFASITSLNEFTEYYVRVAAATSTGLGPYSNAVVETTNEAKPIGPPQIIVTGVKADTINIILLPPDINEINGKITNYQVIYYGEAVDQTVITIDIQPNIDWITKIYYSLTQLEENEVYHIKSRIWTKIGSGPFSVDTIRKTLPSVPSGAPTELTINSVQTTSLSLGWNPPPIKDQNSDTIAYRVQYYGNSFDSSVRTATTSNTNVVLAGLEEGEVYTVIVCGYNSLGNGPCEVIEKSTQEDLPTGYPQSVNAVALHDTGISVFWNPLVEDKANGAILGYEVRVNGTLHDSQTHRYLTNNTILSVSHLEEFERYLVQVRAINSIGAGPYSSAIEVRTHQDVPDTAPKDLQGTANKESILLTWNAPVAADINGEITTFEVHYAGSMEDRSNRTVRVGNVTRYNLAQLVADETYLIQVRAYTSVGPGPYTNWIVIRTLEDAPTNPPADVTTIAHSSTTIKLLWKAPLKHGQNGVITGYDVEITAVSSSYFAKQSVGGSYDLYTFTNLKPHREYSLRVAAKTQAGVGPFSGPITELTLQDIPDLAPSSLHLVNITARAVTIAWTPVSDDAINGVLQHYELTISSFASTIKMEPELTNYTLFGLVPNSYYSVRIAAETFPGTGPYTSPLNFTTHEEAPSEGPIINSINSITSTAFVVVWSTTSDSARNGAINGYEVTVTEELTGSIAFDRISDANNAKVTVSNLNEYTRYRVSVKAINSAGKSPSTIISVETAQSKPSSHPLYISSIVNTTWIELNWFPPNEEDQNGLITGYEIHINNRIITTNSTEYTFTDLEEAMQYTIQVAAMTLIGTGPLSTPINITTLSIAPTAPPQDVNASAIGSVKIRVTWEPIPALEQNGHILRYIVHYWRRKLNDTIAAVSTNSSTEVTLESLEPHTVYEILVFGVNAIGNSPMSHIVNAKTWEDVPTIPPGNFSVHVLSPSSVKLTWTPVSSTQRNGIIIHQTITYQGSSIDTDTHAINIDSGSTYYTFTQLYPSVTYNFTLHQSTVVGNGPRSYAAIKMPVTNPTTAPVDIQITNIETGFQVEWNELPLASRNGEIMLYEVSLTLVSNGSNDSVNKLTYNSTNTEIGLTNLTVSTLYSVKVRAMTSAGYGPYSEPLEALTAPEELQCFGYFSLYERDPCQNGAICRPQNSNDFTCDCVPGYDGIICQNEINECHSHECEHGTCIDRINNFTCNCYAGYSGRLCEVELNECSPEPCQNGGTCIDHVKDYQCICSYEYLGNDCEYPNRCLTSPCQQGTCYPVQDQYVCSCYNGYEGEHCEDIDECTSGIHLCEQTCTNTAGNYQCSCYANYFLYNNYSCQIVTFTVDISLHGYGSTYARFHVNIQFDPSTSNLNVTNQIYSRDLSFGNDKYEVDSPTTNNNLTISRLKPNRLYLFYVKTTGMLYSTDSNYFILETATSNPSAPPENVRVTASSPNNLRIEWEAPPSTDRNGIIIGYTLQYKKSNESSYSTVLPTSIALANITNLNEFTEYEIKVAAATASGLGPYSDAIVETTSEGRPVSAPKVQVTGVKAETINITLLPPDINEINGKITNYQVIYYGEAVDPTVITIDIQPNIDWISKIYYSLTQLEENEVYHIKSRIWTKKGSGPYSVDTIRKTLPTAPSGAPSDLIFNSILTTSLSLNWNPPPLREQNSDTIAYRVQYYGNSFDNSVRNIKTTNTNVVLKELEEGEVYTVMVCSYNNLGNGPCEVIEQSTQEVIPTGYPQYVNAVSIDDKGIRVFWNRLSADQANGAILRYEVRVNGTQHDSQTHRYLTNKTILSVSHLEEFERYLVQVRAINSIGAGPYSSAIEVRTHQDVPDTAPKDLQGTANKESILLTWNAPVAADINGEITTFEVHYAGTMEDRSNRTVRVGNVTQYNLAQLVADETYLIQVRAYTSVGPGPYTNWIVIRTIEDAPTNSPVDVTSIAHSSTVIKLLWKAPLKQGQNGVIIGYDVEITAVSSSYFAKQSVGGSYDMYTFTNLKPHREYSLRVAAKTQAGVGPFSEPITELTLQNIPDLAPSSLHLVKLTARAVTIAWTPVSDDAINGVLQHYELVSSAFTSTIKIEPELTNYTLLGLVPNRHYSVRIAAETFPGTGPYTSPLNFTTYEEAPSEGPIINSINSITSTAFVVVWSTTSDSAQYGAITGYEVTVTEELTGSIAFDRISDANNAKVTVSNLNEYTRYRVSVKAINSAGKSPSTIISVETAQSKPSSPPLYISSIVNTTWIELNWFPPNEEDQNGILTGYEIHINNRIITTNSTEYTFTYLEEAMQYTIQVAAMTVIGTGPLSTPINITTLSVAPTAPPQDVNASAIGSDKIRVTWEPIPILEQNGHILRYIVHYWRRKLNDTIAAVSTNSSTEVTLESLEPHTVYEILVFGVNAIGNSPMSHIVTAKTWEDVPTIPPGNFSVHVLSPSSVNLTWTPVFSTQRNGIIIHQTITYQGSSIDTDTHAINIDSGRTNYTFTQLYPSVTYNFTLHQSTVVGNGPRSYAAIKMPVTNPTTAPVDIQITNIETGFQVEWNELPLASRNGEIMLYEVSLTLVSNGSNDSVINLTYNSTNTDIGLVNLTASTLYSVKVRAMTSAGYGPYSEPLEVLTAPEGLQCFGYFSLYERDPCQNGAICRPQNSNDFTCDCVPGYDGIICQNEINECHSHECEHGTCIDRINNFTCNCYAGYSGRLCEVELNECSSEPCQNGGTCIDHVNIYQCICPLGFSGHDCQYPNKCLRKPCRFGICFSVQDDYFCSCDLGYNGENCDVNINDCADVVCENGGECIDGITKFECKCHNGYKGMYCQYTGKVLTCESETESKIKWPATEYSKTAVMPCQYIDPSFVLGNATRKCSQSGTWESVQMTECIRAPFVKLSLLGDLTQIDVHNITEVLQKTAYTVRSSSILSPQEIMMSLNLTGNALNSMSKLNNEEKSSLNSSLSEEFVSIFSAIVSPNNVEFFSGDYKNMTQILFKNLKLSSILSAQTFTKTPNKTCSSFISENIQLTVTELELKHNSTYSNILSDCNQDNSTNEGNSILFPSSLTNTLITSNAQLGISVLHSKTLGQILTQSPSGEYEPASTLTMIELASDLPNQLKNAIHLNFPILNTEHKNNKFNTHCVYWDSATQRWSDRGLSVYQRDQDSITCSSTHLSTFIVLFETKVKSNMVETVLKYIIYAVYGVSLICLVVAIVLIVSLGKKLVESDIHIGQLSLGIAITLSVTSYLIGVFSSESARDPCNIIAGSVYFFSLASTTCFLAEGVAICFKFVLHKVKRRIHIILIALGWIVPIPLAVFRIVSDWNNLGVKGQYCWLSSQNSVTWSMTEPILIIFFITFICMLVSLIRWRILGEIEEVRIARFALIGHMILAPFILSPWILTIFNMYVPVSFYKWAISILITLQGILFLILYAIRICWNRKKKVGGNGENNDIPVESLLQLRSLDRPTTIRDEINYSKLNTYEEITTDFNEGAKHYPNEELTEKPEKQPEIDYKPFPNDDHAEYNLLEESKVDVIIPSDSEHAHTMETPNSPIV